jgi:hypothetical protein
VSVLDLACLTGNVLLLCNNGKYRFWWVLDGDDFFEVPLVSPSLDSLGFEVA